LAVPGPWKGVSQKAGRFDMSFRVTEFSTDGTIALSQQLKTKLLDVLKYTHRLNDKLIQNEIL